MTGERVAVCCEQCVASGHLYTRFLDFLHNVWFVLSENVILVCVQWCTLWVWSAVTSTELWVCDGGLLLADWPPGVLSWPMTGGWPPWLVTHWSLLVRCSGPGRSDHWSVQGEERRVLLTTYRIQSPSGGTEQCVLSSWQSMVLSFLSFRDIFQCRASLFIEFKSFGVIRLFVNDFQSKGTWF